MSPESNPPRNRTRPIRAWPLLALSMALVFPCLAGQTGTLDYPSEDNLDFKEGTVEFWFQPLYDTASFLPSSEKFQGLSAILDLAGESGGLSVSHYAGASAAPSATLTVRLNSEKQDLFGFSGGEFTPKKGEWHHFALAWKGREVNFYLDGAIAPGRKGKMSPFAVLEFLNIAFGAVGRHPIRVGDKWNTNGKFAVDDLRVSSVARAVEQLGFAVGALKPDPSTRILDSFEESFEPDGKTRTRPKVIVSGEGGLPSPGCRFVEGKFGKALSLYRGD
ncbi:MAG: LamG-like jellyroll fold domain-containing protein [Verrucomicrobiia bacterium]